MQCLFKGLSMSHVDHKKWAPTPGKPSPLPFLETVLIDRLRCLLPSCMLLHVSLVQSVRTSAFLDDMHSLFRFFHALLLWHIWLHFCFISPPFFFFSSSHYPKTPLLDITSIKTFFFFFPISALCSIQRVRWFLATVEFVRTAARVCGLCACVALTLMFSW